MENYRNKYIIVHQINNFIEAVSPSKYPYTFNLGPLNTGHIYNNKEEALNILEKLNKSDYNFKILKVETAVKKDIIYSIEKIERECKKENPNLNFINNLSYGIKQSINLIEDEIDNKNEGKKE